MKSKSRFRAPALAASAAALVAALLVVAGRAFGLLITLTDSAAPAGIYRAVSAPAVRGELVAACLPAGVARLGMMRGYLAAGSCPGGAEPVAKIAEAFAGDVVDVEPGWVAVDGARFANSRAAAHDSAGRPLHHVAWGRYQVRSGEAWLFGFNDARSWDARYFGPVPLANVRGVLKPVLTWRLGHHANREAAHWEAVETVKAFPEERARDFCHMSEPAGISRTHEAARKQIAAMDCERFDIGVLRPDGKMLLREDQPPDNIVNAIA